MIDQINVLVAQVENLLKTQPILSGVFGAYILGIVTYLIRNVPARIRAFITRYFTITVDVENYDTMFYGVISFLEQYKIAEKSRTLKVNCGRYGGNNNYVVSTGYGRHIFWWKRRPYFLVRNKDDASHTEMVKETISITTYGISQKPLRKLLTECQKYIANDEDRNGLYRYDYGSWHKMESLQERPLSTVIIDNDLKQTLQDHIDFFLGHADFYQSKGIPYRTGILLSGPPGTGKTSLIKAIANFYGKNLYFISLREMVDSSLQSAFSSIKSNSIIVIEDIDAIQAAVTRSVSKEEKVTTSGLLNVIDGFYASYGRILFITSNYPEKLDKALLRPGRCDLKLELGYVTPDIAEKMFERFYDKSIKIESVRLNMTAADLENIAIANLDNPKKYLEEVCR